MTARKIVRETYRRLVDSDVWHFNRRCRWWPLLAGEPSVGRNQRRVSADRVKGWSGRAGKPSTGELCDECLAKERGRPGPEPEEV